MLGSCGRGQRNACPRVHVGASRVHAHSRQDSAGVRQDGTAPHPRPRKRWPLHAWLVQPPPA
eukprot:13676997-Alexandrium_andersonii.AAC.1